MFLFSHFSVALSSDGSLVISMLNVMYLVHAILNPKFVAIFFQTISSCLVVLCLAKHVGCSMQIFNMHPMRPITGTKSGRGCGCRRCLENDPETHQA